MPLFPPSAMPPHEPKQQRGKLRVAAILATAEQLFGAKGFDKTTMTEIAAVSGTAIGSLYRFFPTKEAIADQLLLHFAQHTQASLAALGSQSARMTPDNLADALVDFTLELQSPHRWARTLVDAIGGSEEKKMLYRNALREGVASLLRAVIPSLNETRATAMAITLLHILKGLGALGREEAAIRLLLVAEIRQLVRLYLRAAAG